MNRIELAVTPANEDLIYALCSKASDNGYYGMFMSENAGNTWTQIISGSFKNLLGWSTNGSDDGGQGWYDLSLAVSPTNADEIYVGGVNVWKSTNAGYNWYLKGHWYGGGGADYVHADIHMLAFSPSGDLFAANDGGIYITEDGGENWDDLSDGIHILQIYRIGASALDSNVVVGGNQDNGTYKMNGTNWNEIYGGDGMECLVDYSDPDVIYATIYYGNLYKSTNGGYSFSTVTPNNASGAWITPYVMHPLNHNTLIAGYKDVYKTTNGASSWTKISNNLSGANTLRSITYAPSNTNYIYTATYSNIWKTTNGGESWTNISSGLPGYSITDIEVSAFDANTLWITLSGYGENQKVYMSDNGGESWTNYSDGLPNVPANCLVYQKYTDDAIYLGTDIGVYYRKSDLDSWIPFGEGLPNVIVNELEIHYGSGKIRAATYGRGLWESTMNIDNNTAPFPEFVVTENTIMRWEDVHFQDASVNSPTSWSWTFEGGTPATSDLQHPSNIQYTSSGVYDVSLEVSNENGSHTITKHDYITVISDLVGDFSVEATNGDAPFEVSFTDISAGNAESWYWDFDDGNTSTEQNPVNTFQVPGVYDITLTISDDEDEVSVTKSNYISVNSSIIAEFTAAPLSGALPLSVDFNDLSTGGVNTWHWNFGDGSTSVEQNPSHIYETSGSFNVELTSGNGYYSEDKTKIAFIEIWPSNTTDIEVDELLRIYPNPGDGIFNIEILDMETEINLEVYSLEGKHIYSESFIGKNNQIERINLNDQPEGTYILKIYSKDKIRIEKLVIE